MSEIKTYNDLFTPYELKEEEKQMLIDFTHDKEAMAFMKKIWEKIKREQYEGHKEKGESK